MVNFYSQDTDMDNSRYCALKQACNSGVLPIARSILQSEDPACQDLLQFEPLCERHLQKCLFEAFANSHFDVARYLIREARVDMKQIEANLARHAATGLMPIKNFEFLIQEGWDINSPIYPFTPALSSVLDSFPLTKWFLENGADPNLGPDTYPPYTGNSAMVPNSKHVFEWAARSNPATAISVMNLLRHHGLRYEGGIPLHFVSSRRSPQYYEQHKTPDSIFRVEDEVDIDPPFDPSSSRVPVLRYLLDLGFDPNASDVPRLGPRACGPPLHYAVRAGSVENARFLLQNGADPWAEDTLGSTALEAARYGHDPKRQVIMQKLIMEFI